MSMWQASESRGNPNSILDVAMTDEGAPYALPGPKNQ